VALVDGDGRAVAAHVTLDGEVVHLALDEVLAAGGDFLLRAGADVADDAGREPFGDPPGFMSGGAVRTGAVTPRGLGVDSADRCVVVRFATDEPSWSESCVADRCLGDGESAGHEAAISFGDALDGRPLAWDVQAWDETTRPVGEISGRLDPPSALPLAITEILTHPRGPRTSQQFVELYNSGAQPIDLGALTLHTGAGANALPSLSLAAGGWAVVVPSGYVAGAAGDAPPAPGALLVRLADAHLGGRGLKEAGEPIWIEDASGRVVTRWSGWPLTLAAGQSVTRSGPCDVAASFAPTPSGGATPGGP
jgi:hypothetical protein